MEILSELSGFRKCSPRCRILNAASASQSPKHSRPFQVPNCIYHTQECLVVCSNDSVLLADLSIFLAAFGSDTCTSTDNYNKLCFSIPNLYIQQNFTKCYKVINTTLSIICYIPISYCNIILNSGNKTQSSFCHSLNMAVPRELVLFDLFYNCFL